MQREDQSQWKNVILEGVGIISLQYGSQWKDGGTTQQQKGPASKPVYYTNIVFEARWCCHGTKEGYITNMKPLIDPKLAVKQLSL